MATNTYEFFAQLAEIEALIYNKKLLSRMEESLQGWSPQQTKSEWVEWAKDYFNKKGITVC